VKFFEINGIGGFQLCDYKKALEEYSPIDPEKYSFKTIDEAIEKMKYYLEKPNERYEIAKIQCEYFHTHHTYEIRLTELLNLI
jgi:spore maturation protein CgeB